MMDICKTCGFDKDLKREMMLLDNSPMVLAKYFRMRCEECGHQSDGSTIVKEEISD